MALVVAFATATAGQAKQSVVVEHVSFGDFPVEIIGLEAAGVSHDLLEIQPRKFVASFDAPEDWLKRIAFSVKNKTDKTIVAITFQGSLATAAEGDTPMSIKVRFGQELDESAFTGRAPQANRADSRAHQKHSSKPSRLRNLFQPAGGEIRVGRGLNSEIWQTDERGERAGDSSR